MDITPNISKTIILNLSYLKFIFCLWASATSPLKLECCNLPQKKYSWPLNNAGFFGYQPLLSQKFAYNIWLQKKTTTNNLLLTRNLTDNMNSQLKHTLYFIYYIQYSYNKARGKY